MFWVDFDFYSINVNLYFDFEFWFWFLVLNFIFDVLIFPSHLNSDFGMLGNFGWGCPSRLGVPKPLGGAQAAWGAVVLFVVPCCFRWIWVLNAWGCPSCLGAMGVQAAWGRFCLVSLLHCFFGMLLGGSGFNSSPVFESGLQKSMLKIILKHWIYIDCWGFFYAKLSEDNVINVFGWIFHGFRTDIGWRRSNKT